MNFQSNRLVIAIVASNLLSIGLLASRIISSDSFRYVFMLWNILLAAIPAMLSLWLVARIRRYGWARPKQLALTAVWLAFLPNSFYVMTDFVHLRPTFEADIIYDITLLASFMINGLILGYFSVYLVHRELLKRVSTHTAWLVISAIVLASSFAIYLGRFTRWNTWDLLLQPAGLLFDVSDRFVNPGAHPQTFSVTILLFVFLMAIYFVVWEIARYLSGSYKNQPK